jgi:hypothetical protein
MTPDEIQAWKDSAEEVISGMTPQTIPREVADRLAKALANVGNSVGMDFHFIKGDYLRGGKLTAADAEKLNGVMDAAASALAAYRKAVADAR